MKPHQVIQKPLVTEKGTLAQQFANQYYFSVLPTATKNDVRLAVESIFNVDVVSVRTLNMDGKKKRVGAKVGRKASWKKAIVTLKEGDKIEFLEGA